MGGGTGTGYEESSGKKANQNRMNWRKYGWEAVQGVLIIEGVTDKEGTTRTDNSSGDKLYLFSGNSAGEYQIPLKRVTIKENSIEGVLINTFGAKQIHPTKGKVKGVIKRLN